LGALVGSAAVAVYSVAIQVQMAYSGFSYHINNVFLPKISSLAALSTDMKDINAIFVKISRIETIVLYLILCGFIFYGYKFIFFWVGASFELSYFAALLLMIPFTIYLAQSLAMTILQAKNKHAPCAVFYFFLSIASLFVAIPAVKAYGLMGCAIATSIALLLGQGLFANIYYKKVGIDIASFWNNFFKISKGVLPVIAIAAVVEYFFITSSVYILGTKILFFSFTFAASMWLFILNDYERGLVKKPINFLMEKYAKHNR
jgi:O-antigen/teichoic acid export membrane protein